MTGAMLSLPPVSLGLLGAIVVLASVAGVVDVLHWKTWTWPRAHRSRTATLALVVLVPAFGLCWYLLRIRPGVEQVARAGRAAHLPFERFPGDTSSSSSTPTTTVADAPPAGLGSFGELRPTTVTGPATSEPLPAEQPAAVLAAAVPDNGSATPAETGADQSGADQSGADGSVADETLAARPGVGRGPTPAVPMIVVPVAPMRTVPAASETAPGAPGSGGPGGGIPLINRAPLGCLRVARVSVDVAGIAVVLDGVILQGCAVGDR